MINIAIKNSSKVVHFPLHEGETADIIQLIEQSPHGKVQDTVGDITVRNSWELYSGGFEILNPAWNDFVNNEVVAKIKDEMFIEFPFTASLNKMVLNHAGSYFPYDFKKIDGIFASLVIQLPSLYTGGQIQIRHKGRTVTSEFSSTVSSNAYSTFYSAFYADDLHSEHASAMVTKGCRVCLFYNLISRRSVVPTAPRRYTNEVELATLLKNWNHRGKLVYALKHKYLESNLSIENLKTTDRSIANFLLYVANISDLNVCLTILNKESSGRGSVPVFDFDSDDEGASRWKSYSLSKLIAIDGTNMLATSLTVDFDAEVIPEDCFKNTDPHRKTVKQTDNAGGDVTRFHRSAAIVFWPKQFLVGVPKKNGASVVDLEKIFLKEMASCRGKVQDDNVKTKLINWAKEIVSSRGNKSIGFIKAIVELKDIPLIQSLFMCGVILNEDSVSLVVDVCEKYGWKIFADQVPEMFRPLEMEDAIELLGRIGTAEMEEDQKAVVCNSMKVTFNKLHFFGAMKDAEQEFLLSACRLVEKMDIEMSDVIKAKPILFVVPVLLRLVPNNSNKLSPFWKDVAQYFDQEMEKEASKPIHTWRRNDTSTCSCKDCTTLNTFLRSDQESINFTIGKQRRLHLRLQLIRMNNMQHQEYPGRHTGILAIRKTSQSRPNAEQRAFSITNSAKLRAILPN